jgi:NAD(P)-dependent dehydrogenase (short-subunit alcohol dehydrogenase family)
MELDGKTILITGAARRVGRAMALAIARAGGDVIIHHRNSPEEAQELQLEINTYGVKAYILQADLGDLAQVREIIPRALEYGPIFGLVNNAAIFESLTFENTDFEAWERHQTINLTAPFLLSKAFAEQVGEIEGRIINILDWRALRPGADHFPYTISKAGLAALTRSMAIALAPQITVNGIAFGAILPPADGTDINGILDDYPVKRWADLEEVGETLLFLLTGPAYITGEIIHLDGGRHLV